jgi:hypothetical protein
MRSLGRFSGPKSDQAEKPEISFKVTNGLETRFVVPPYSVPAAPITGFPVHLSVAGFPPQIPSNHTDLAPK